MKNCWLLIAVLAVGTSVAGQTSSRFEGIARQEEFRTWLKLTSAEIDELQAEEGDSKLSLIQQWLHDLVVNLVSTSYPTAVASNISQQCKNDSIEYVHNLYRRAWAMQSKF
jgi:hypothetical protein